MAEAAVNDEDAVVVARCVGLGALDDWLLRSVASGGLGVLRGGLNGGANVRGGGAALLPSF